MIEAVNSVISNAPFTRFETQKVDVTNAQDPLEDTGAVSAAQDDQVSILSSFDAEFSTTVTQILNPQNGQVLLQFPSEQSLEAREFGESTASDTSQDQDSQSPSSTQQAAVAQTVVVTSFDVFESNQNAGTPSANALGAQAQAELAINALNEAAQSGFAALSSEIVTA